MSTVMGDASGIGENLDEVGHGVGRQKGRMTASPFAAGSVAHWHDLCISVLRLRGRLGPGTVTIEGEW